MKNATLLLVILFVHGFANADEQRVSSTEPVVVATPDQWQSTKVEARSGFPVETYRLVPPASRNAVCLFSILDKDKPEFTDSQFLKKVLRGDSRPYVSSPDELSKIELKEMKIGEGLGFYANFVDPDLVGKPVKEGSYKTATPIILSLGSKYLIKITVLCDEVDGADYRDSIKIVQSIRIKKQ